MSPISASPVCTPTSVIHSTESVPPEDQAEPDEPFRLRVLPTWIATPPTPPRRPIRRSVTCVVHHPLSPSASLPSAGGLAPEPPPRRIRASSESSLTRSSLSPSENEVAFRTPSTESEFGSEPVLLDPWEVEKGKDDVRKYHALMELLTTEVSYLADLRILFSIYLRNLPTLCRTTSTFSRGPSSRNNSHTHLPRTSMLSDPGLYPLTSIQAKPKPSARHVFTDRQLDLLTRNAEQVLQLHENFVQELRVTMLPLGFSMEMSADAEAEQAERIGNVDAAVEEVSAKFATEASRFDAYQTFCIGHPKALQVVHLVRDQHPAEWEAYEQQCASMVASMNGESSSCTTSPDRSPERAPQSFMGRKKTSSLTSVDDAVRRVRSRANSIKERSTHRLAFLDYMIKPIQRICKYPLLLDQLRSRNSTRAMVTPSARTHVDVVVESAAQAMRHVASAVDEARHRQDVAMQSSLIVSRISLSHPSMATSNMAAAHATLHRLTPSFLSSLGTCLLAGSLDVMHHQSSRPSTTGANINAKYLGAFLYLGGYLILVKVKGKVYEPRHWFSLADFDIVDLEEEDTSLPCTFSLTCKGHQFDLTAACQKEKDAWLSSIHESRLHPPSWINEPTVSIHLDGKGETVPSTLDGPYEMINALPTIQSLPELAKDDISPDLTESVLAAFRGQVPQNPEVLKAEMPSKPEAVTSRRSSTASVKAIFTPTSDADTILIRRSSPAARSQVDQGLQDVISEPVLAARSYASTREELFQAPKILRSFPRSNSALSLTGLTKNRLSRHESVRVPRRKSLAAEDKTSATLGRQKQRLKKLSIISTSEAESLYQPPSDLSASTFSQCSSLTSALTSPASDSPPISEQIPGSRRPSIVTHSVRTSPAQLECLTSSPAASTSSKNSDSYRTLTQGFLRRWTKGHRRSRSAPDDQNIPDAASRAQSPVLPEVEFGAALSLTVSPEQIIQAPAPTVVPRLLSPGAPVAFRHSSAESPATPFPLPTSKKSSIFKRLRGIDLGLTP
ncbi:hypothetical protein FB45DRAFT_827670 [Roridomyces roridus]|uniref:DH domain-containing protein n=1 Tax=Roridomyces roridus TaxID=1738132 RepID=A0AAD7C544_9AGAR|nr:hypothetical protein FB45DRAFT_827670 [Roridomyces roridus]